VNQDDRTLIARCLAGSQRAWDALVERYGRLVYSVPRRYGLADADAEDVFQAAFIALYRNLASLREHERLASWLITTAHRETWRVGKRNPKYAELDEHFPDVSAPSDELASSWEEQHLVRRGLAELGPPCAPLLEALFLEPGDANYERIAERLGMRVGSIGPTRARCLGKLERILRRMGLGRGVSAGDPDS
jgi:RNA polymerase sigma factor (sigma-70 family)